MNRIDLVASGEILKKRAEALFNLIISFPPEERKDSVKRDRIEIFVQETKSGSFISTLKELKIPDKSEGITVFCGDDTYYQAVVYGLKEEENFFIAADLLAKLLKSTTFRIIETHKNNTGVIPEKFWEESAYLCQIIPAK
jgi:hypothetical protein